MSEMYKSIMEGLQEALDDAKGAKKAKAQTRCISYKGYSGTIVKNETDNGYHGEVVMDDELITFDGESQEDIQECFADMIDGSIAYNEYLKNPETRSFSELENELDLEEDMQKESKGGWDEGKIYRKSEYTGI